MFICTVCSESVDQGMQTYECKHYFCGKHISDGTLESLPDDLFSCPVCKSPFRLEDLYNCTSDESSSESNSEDECDEDSDVNCDGINSLLEEVKTTEDTTIEQFNKLTVEKPQNLSKPMKLNERKNARQPIKMRANDEYFSPYSIFGGHIFLNGWKRHGYKWMESEKCLKELRCCSILPIEKKNNETDYAFVVICLQHIHIFKNKFIQAFIFGRSDFIENTKNDEKFNSKAATLVAFSRINSVKIIEKNIILIDSNSTIHILEFGTKNDQLQFKKRYTHQRIEKPLSFSSFSLDDSADRHFLITSNYDNTLHSIQYSQLIANKNCDCSVKNFNGKMNLKQATTHSLPSSAHWIDCITRKSSADVKVFFAISYLFHQVDLHLIVIRNNEKYDLKNSLHVSSIVNNGVLRGLSFVSLENRLILSACDPSAKAVQFYNINTTSTQVKSETVFSATITKIVGLPKIQRGQFSPSSIQIIPHNSFDYLGLFIITLFKQGRYVRFPKRLLVEWKQ